MLSTTRLLLVATCWGVAAACSGTPTPVAEASAPTLPTDGRAFLGVPEFPWQPEYDVGNTSIKKGDFDCVGTRTEPAVILGGNYPQGDIRIANARFCVLDGLNLADAGRIVVRDADHLIVRNLQQGNHPSRSGLIINGTNVLVEKSRFHHNQGPDRHGIVLGCRTSNIWLLANELSYNGGQSIQFGHNCKEAEPDLIYVAGNQGHNNREAGAATKIAGRVVFSGNLFTGHRASRKNVRFTHDDGTTSVAASGSDGAGILIGAAGATRFVAFLGNEYRGNHRCVRIEELQEAGTRAQPNAMLLNELCDGAPVAGVDNGRPVGLQLDKRGGEILVCNSTLANLSVAVVSNQRPQNFEVRFGGVILDSVKRLKSLEVGLTQQPKCDLQLFARRFEEVMGHSL